jgi:hypothetical protein
MEPNDAQRAHIAAYGPLTQQSADQRLQYANLGDQPVKVKAWSNDKPASPPRTDYRASDYDDTEHPASGEYRRNLNKPLDQFTAEEREFYYHLATLPRPAKESATADPFGLNAAARNLDGPRKLELANAVQTLKKAASEAHLPEAVRTVRAAEITHARLLTAPYLDRVA